MRNNPQSPVRPSHRHLQERFSVSPITTESIQQLLFFHSLILDHFALIVTKNHTRIEILCQKVRPQKTYVLPRKRVLIAATLLLELSKHAFLREKSRRLL